MKRIAGFTLIELMVTLAVLAILTMVAVPSYQRLTTMNRMAAEMNDFSGSFHLARTEAIKHGVTVTMCVSGDGANCTGGDWHRGWIVFLDPGADQQVEDAAEQLIQVYAGFDGTDTLTGNTAVATAIAFSGAGFLVGVGNGTVTLNSNPQELAYRRCAVISRIGRIDLRRAGDC